MTTATDACTMAGLDLRSMSDEALAAMFGDGEQPLSPAAMAEMARRDRVATRRRKAAATRAAAEAEWMDAAHAHFLAAEARCRGNLLARGSTVGEAFPALYRMSERDFGRQASEEMREFCGSSPRPTRQEFIRSAFAPRKGAHPWHEPGWTEAGKMGTTPAMGEAATGAAERAAGRAERAVWAAARAGNAHAPKTAPQAPPEAPPAGPAGEAARVTPGTIAARQPASGDERTQAARERLRVTLDELRAFYLRYAYLPGGPGGAAAVSMPLWAAHTFHRHRLPEGGGLGLLAGRATPRLAALSAQPASGKSTVLELLRVTCANTFGLDHEPTASGMIDSINDEYATLLLDEGGILIGRGRRKEEVIAALLGGYRPNGTKLRTRRGTSQRLSLYAPVAIAGLDVMEKGTGENVRALLTRMIIYRMAPPPEGVALADFDAEEDQAEAEGASYRAALLSAMTDLAGEVAAARPAMPEGVRGRHAQIWRILLAIAEAAGGHWPADARKACQAFCLGQSDRPPMPPGLALLTDMRDAWPAGAQVALTTDLVRSLRAIDGAPWQGMWDTVSAPGGMAALLAPYDVSPVDVVLPDGRGVEGYRLACLEPAWAGAGNGRYGRG